MNTNERTVAVLAGSRNVMVALSAVEGASLEGFFGAVFRLDAASASAPDFSGKTVYLCGDLARARGLDLKAAERVLVVRDLSSSFDDAAEGWALVDVGQVPILVHGVGVYYRRFFDPSVDYFRRVCAEHAFQSLTESTKPGVAHRTGIYLTPVEQHADELRFRLLRCSTNLSGPTENFRATDARIVDALNAEANLIFQNHAPLNHVLAQVYHNTPAAEAQKQSKARISAHADKTKDMPASGIMAFCTFYDGLDRLRPMARDAFDRGHREVSGLVRLRFRRKALDAGPLPAQFTLTLYPHSVFFMPLSTNRLYTHELQSSALDAELLPTRMGYVVRCSSTEAVHKDGQTFLKVGGKLTALEPPTPEGMNELRRLYAEENKSEGFIDYGDRFLFSMNRGDYTAPER